MDDYESKVTYIFELCNDLRTDDLKILLDNIKTIIEKRESETK